MATPSFQSTPVIADRRHDGWSATPGVSERFQSTPVIADRRHPRPPPHRAPRPRFNPRRSLLTGDTAGVPEDTRSLKFQSTPVIADRRHRSGSTASPPAAGFQSTPVIADRRHPAPSRMSPCQSLFQSTPVIADRRHESESDADPEQFEVSIHAGHC